MNYQDRIVGGGLPSLMGQGDINTPGAFQFAQKSEPVVRYAVGGNVYGYQGYEDATYEDPYGQETGAAPVVPPVVQQPPANQQMLDIGQRTPQVRPDPVKAPAKTLPGGIVFTTDDRGNVIRANAPTLSDTTAWHYGSFSPDIWKQLGYSGAAPTEDKLVWEQAQGGEGPSGGSGNWELTPTESFSEFQNWLADKGYRTTTTFSGGKGDQTRTDWLLDKNGNIVGSRDASVDLGSTNFLDKVMAVAPALIVGAATGGLGLPAWAAGALAGSAAPAMKGFVEGQNLGDFLSTTGKGAVLGAIGGQASSYINPAAAEFGKAVGGGNELLTKIATNAAAGAGKGLVGSALTGGKNLEEAILGGAASGALNTGINALIGDPLQAIGISPKVSNVLMPALVAAANNRDWQAALAQSGLASLIGSVKAPPAAAAPGLNDYDGKTIIFDDGSRVELDQRGQVREAYDPEGNDVSGRGKGKELPPMPTTAPTPALAPSEAPAQRVEIPGSGVSDITDYFPIDTSVSSPFLETPAPAQRVEIPGERQQDVTDYLANAFPAPTPAPAPFTPKTTEAPAQQVNVIGTKPTENITDILGQLPPVDIDTLIGAPPAATSPAQQVEVAGKRDQLTDYLNSILPDDTFSNYPTGLQTVEVTGKRTNDVLDTLDSIFPPLPDNMPPTGVIEGPSSIDVVKKKPDLTDINYPVLDDIPWEQLLTTPPIDIPQITAPPVTVAPPSKGGSVKAPAPAPAAVKPPATPSSTGTGGFDLNSLLALLALMGGGQQAAAPVQPLFRSDLDVEKIFGERWFT